MLVVSIIRDTNSVRYFNYKKLIENTINLSSLTFSIFSYPENSHLFPCFSFNSHKLGYHYTEWEDFAKFQLHADRRGKSCPPPLEPMKRASLWFASPVWAIAQNRHHLWLVFFFLQLMWHALQLQRRIRCQSRAQSICSRWWERKHCNGEFLKQVFGHKTIHNENRKFHYAAEWNRFRFLKPTQRRNRSKTPERGIFCSRFAFSLF